MSLVGQRVLVLRPVGQAEDVASELRRLGAVPVLLPALTIVPPADPAPLERCLSRLSEYDWLVLTSTNGVEAVLARVGSLPAGLRVAAVGIKTAEALTARGARVDLIPPSATAESLLEALLDVHAKMPLGHVLFPKADRARDVLPTGLRAAGVALDDPIAYRSLDAVAEGPELDSLRRGAIDWVLVTSPSTLEVLIDRVDASVWQRTRLASIGPISSAAIRRHGLSPVVEADPHTLDALIAAIASL